MAEHTNVTAVICRRWYTDVTELGLIGTTKQLIHIHAICHVQLIHIHAIFHVQLCAQKNISSVNKLSTERSKSQFSKITTNQIYEMAVTARC